MTLAQIEARLEALEQAVAVLQSRLPGTNGPPLGKQEELPKEEDIIPRAEYPFVPDVPSLQEWVVRARIVSIDSGEEGLALSEEEWARLPLENEHE